MFQNTADSCCALEHYQGEWTGNNKGATLPLCVFTLQTVQNGMHIEREVEGAVATHTYKIWRQIQHRQKAMSKIRARMFSVLISPKNSTTIQTKSQNELAWKINKICDISFAVSKQVSFWSSTGQLMPDHNLVELDNLHSTTFLTKTGRLQSSNRDKLSGCFWQDLHNVHWSAGTMSMANQSRVTMKNANNKILSSCFETCVHKKILCPHRNDLLFHGCLTILQVPSIMVTTITGFGYGRVDYNSEGKIFWGAPCLWISS